MSTRADIPPTRKERTGPGHEKGEYEEEHPAFGLVAVSRSSGTPRTLFQSDLQHQETIHLTISRAVRGRALMRDWTHPKRELIEIEMSLAQWGAVVSSIGIGSGVPVTIRRTEGDVRVPGLPYEPRIAAVVSEARGSTTRLLEHVRGHFNAVKQAFEEKRGIKAQREAIFGLEHALRNAESNQEFAVKSVAEAAELVTSQAKADIEAHILAAANLTGLTAPILTPELSAPTGALKGVEWEHGVPGGVTYTNDAETS